MKLCGLCNKVWQGGEGVLCLKFMQKLSQAGAPREQPRWQTTGKRGARHVFGCGERTHTAFRVGKPMHWWTLQQLKSRKPQTRREAVEKLLAEENPQAVDELLPMLSDAAPEVRRAVAVALGRFKDDK